MKRRAIAAVGAVMLALALAPGTAFGIPILGTLDQSTSPGTRVFMFGSISGVTQTVTAGRTGVLTAVELYCDGGGSTVMVNVSVGSDTSGAQCGTLGWAFFPLFTPVTAGQQFTIAITSGGTPMGLAESASDYSGGQATDVSTGERPQAGVPPTDVSDFAFRTYVWVPSTTTYSWNPNTITVGISTEVTLTTMTAFSEMPLGTLSGSGLPALDGSLPSDFYTVKLAALPSWFSPTDIVCSAQVAPADCTVPKYLAGIHPTGDGSAMTVTIAITGDATPSAAGNGTASGQGCIPGAGPTGPDICSSGQAVLTATPVPTPSLSPAASATAPPTAIAPGESSSGGVGLLWLPALLFAVMGSALAFGTRQTRRLRR
jgi:hypothetical protein